MPQYADNVINEEGFSQLDLIFQAEELLSQNSHLIADQEFPEAFDHFLDHIARLKFVMEVKTVATTFDNYRHYVKWILFVSDMA